MMTQMVNDVSQGILLAVENRRLRIDKLTLLSGNTVPQESKNTVKLKLDELHGDETYTVWHSKNGTKYYKHSLIVRESECSKRYIRIDYSPKALKNPPLHFIRIEISPQHFSSEQFHSILSWLGSEDRIGKIVYKIFRNSTISRIDIALDILGVRPKDFFVDVKSLYTGGVTFGVDGMVKAWKIGGVKSDKKLTGYEKEIDEDITGAIRYLCGSFTRLEFRLNPNIKLQDLDDISNPFKGLKLYSPSLMDDPEIPEWFKLMINLVPISVALHSIKDRNMKEMYIRKLDRHLVDNVANAIWELWPECIEKLNMLMPGYFVEATNKVLF